MHLLVTIRSGAVYRAYVKHATSLGSSCGFMMTAKDYALLRIALKLFPFFCKFITFIIMWQLQSSFGLWAEISVYMTVINLSCTKWNRQPGICVTPVCCHSQRALTSGVVLISGKAWAAKTVWIITIMSLMKCSHQQNDWTLTSPWRAMFVTLKMMMMWKKHLCLFLTHPPRRVYSARIIVGLRMLFAARDIGQGRKGPEETKGKYISQKWMKKATRR